MLPPIYLEILKYVSEEESELFYLKKRRGFWINELGMAKKDRKDFSVQINEQINKAENEAVKDSLKKFREMGSNFWSSFVT